MIQQVVLINASLPEYIDFLGIKMIIFFSNVFQVKCLLPIVLLLTLSIVSTANCDSGDESSEEIIFPYKYPDLDDTSVPYWSAFPDEYKEAMREHDRLEQSLVQTRRLDFKTIETWW